MAEWREVTGLAGGGYEVSDEGEIRSVKFNKTKMMRQDTTHAGYQRVEITDMGKAKKRSVHRMVLEAFVGLCPDGMQCCHGNGVRTDNRLSNLRWDTPVGNKADELKHGTRQFGNQHAASLDDVSVSYIRSCLARRRSRKALAETYEVSRATIDLIATHDTWKHLPPVSFFKESEVAS